MHGNITQLNDLQSKLQEMRQRQHNKRAYSVKLVPPSQFIRVLSVLALAPTRGSKNHAASFAVDNARGHQAYQSPREKHSRRYDT
jgi:hypothetical protein